MEATAFDTRERNRADELAVADIADFDLIEAGPDPVILSEAKDPSEFWTIPSKPPFRS